MPFDKHEEKEYPQNAPSVYAAALKAVETLEGKIATESPENFQFEAKFPKTILKNTLGERTHLCSTLARGVQPGGGGCLPTRCPGAQIDVWRSQRRDPDRGDLVHSSSRTSSW
jgi:hypothetical protein